MPPPSRTIAGLAALCLVPSLAACRGKRVVEDEHTSPPVLRQAPAIPTEIPVDKALPGELAEGAFRAFGLALPRVMNVNARFDDVVFAAGDAPLDRVSNYVRQRVDADKVVTGPEKTVFSRAVVKGSPGVLVTIMVISRGGRTEIEVRNVTLKPAKEGLSEEERWRELGLRPDGTPLDPSTLR